MDHAIADNGVPSGAGIQLGVAPLRQHPLGLIQRDAKTDADAQQPIPGRIPPPRKHLMQIDLADAGPAGQLRFGQILRFVKSRQPPPSGIKRSSSDGGILKMKESKITPEKQNLCSLCRVPLPDGASFCPHCARSIKPWTRQKAPKPLQKKFLHIAALVTALAVIASCT